MGFWQAAALIPGTSRSGAAITGARSLGYGRQDAARLSMLMSIPTIIASGVLLAGEVTGEANRTALRDGAIAALSFMAALAALALMMRLLAQRQLHAICRLPDSAGRGLAGHSLCYWTPPLCAPTIGSSAPTA